MYSPLAKGPKLRCFDPLDTIASGGFLHHRHRGTMYPPFIDLAATRALAASWDSDADDIFIASHQKVGTHLTKRFIVELLRHALADSPGSVYATGDIGHGTVPWPEVMVSQHGRAHFDAHLARTKGQPRLWYIHSRIADLPLRRIHPRTRFVVVYRDPRAVAVSQYFFYRQHPLLAVPADLTLDAFVDLFLAGDLYFGDYHRHVSDWVAAAHPGIAPDRILALRYEDLVEDKPAAARTLARFLLPGWTPPEGTLAAIVQSTGFDRMKEEISGNPQSFHFNPATFFRAGTVRDWENHLSPATAAAIRARTRSAWPGPAHPIPPAD